MRVISERQLAAVLGAPAGTQRVDRRQLRHPVARYRLFALNAQPGVPDREGVTLESAFVGRGMRGRSRLPCGQAA